MIVFPSSEQPGLAYRQAPVSLYEFETVYKMSLLCHHALWYIVAMKRLLESVTVAVIGLALVLCSVSPVQADDPPPTPTLVPITGATTSATQTMQLQEFAREMAYLVGQTTVYTATINGATWAVERRFSYGEAGITIVLMALVLLKVLDLTYRVVTRR